MYNRQTLRLVLILLAIGLTVPARADVDVDTRPLVQFHNESDRVVTLHVNALPDIRVDAQGQAETRMPPGIVDIRASTVGVRTVSFTKVFLSGKSYTLRLWVDRAGLRATGSVVDAPTRAEVTSLLAQISAERTDLKLAKRMIDDEETELNSLGDRIKAEKAEVDAQHATVDKNTADDVDAYNLTADILNSDRERYHDALDHYNDNVGTYNEKLTAFKVKEKHLDDLADAINGQ